MISPEKLEELVDGVIEHRIICGLEPLRGRLYLEVSCLPSHDYRAFERRLHQKWSTLQLPVLHDRPIAEPRILIPEPVLVQSRDTVYPWAKWALALVVWCAIWGTFGLVHAIIEGNQRTHGEIVHRGMSE
jgi:hypothetical protein